MTAKVYFKLGKYLTQPEYRDSLFSVMESIHEIEVVNLIILLYDDFCVKKDGLSIIEAKVEIEQACMIADKVDDDTKKQLMNAYLDE
jgi:hypothetical protein